MCGTPSIPLRNYVARLGKSATPVFIAPYLSPASGALCREHGVSFLDFEANAHLALNAVYIDLSVAERPSAERRELKSIFIPKSARMLRVLFRDPGLTWRVTELARAASLGLGHVSNIPAALRDREWARIVLSRSSTGPGRPRRYAYRQSLVPGSFSQLRVII